MEGWPAKFKGYGQIKLGYLTPMEFTYEFSVVYLPKDRCGMISLFLILLQDKEKSQVSHSISPPSGLKWAEASHWFFLTEPTSSTRTRTSLKRSINFCGNNNHSILGKKWNVNRDLFLSESVVRTLNPTKVKTVFEVKGKAIISCLKGNMDGLRIKEEL